MSGDIRIALDFFDHPKTVKLFRKFGAEGIISLQKLWIYTARYYPKGVLRNMTDDDWAVAFGYINDKQGSSEGVTPLRSEKLRVNKLVITPPQKSINRKVKVLRDTLLTIGFLQKANKSTLKLHDWRENNPYAFFRPERQKQASNAAKVRWEKRDTPNATSNADSNAPSPAPAPAPSPTPTVEEKKPLIYIETGRASYKLSELTKLEKGKFEKLKKAYPDLDLEKLLKECDLYWMGRPGKRKNHYLTFLNWIKNHIKFQTKKDGEDAEKERINKKYGAY